MLLKHQLHLHLHSTDGGSHRASLVAQMIKNLPAMQETWVGSLGWEEPGGLQSTRLQNVGHY